MSEADVIGDVTVPLAPSRRLVFRRTGQDREAVIGVYRSSLWRGDTIPPLWREDHSPVVVIPEDLAPTVLEGLKLLVANGEAGPS